MTRIFLELEPLASIAVRSFVLLILTACIVFALRRRSAAVLHAVWTVGLAGCLATPIVMSLSPSWSLPLFPPAASAVSTALVSAGARQSRATSGIATRATIGNERSMAYNPAPDPTAVTPAGTAYREGVAAQTSSSVVTGQFEWRSLASLATAIWVVGLVAVLLRLLQQSIAVRHRLRQASDLPSADWGEQRNLAARELGLRGNVALKRHGEPISPMVVGLINPVVLLPGDADTWSNERRKLVLLHELAHVQRRDLLTQIMATLACAVYWFNPLAWWGANQMKRLREIACDDAVVVHSGIPVDYAQTLLDLAKRYRRQPMTSALAMAGSSNVEGRIAAILSSTSSRAVLTIRSVRVFSAVALVVSTLVATCQLTSRAENVTEQKSDQTVDETSSESPFEGRESTIVGKWRVTACTFGGAPDPTAIGDVHTISEHNMHRPNRRTQYAYTVDGKGEINLTAPRLGDRHLRGIYSIEGNSLRLCYAYEPDMTRQTEFVSPAGKRVYYYEYQRVEPNANVAPLESESHDGAGKKLMGKWRIASAIFRGEAEPSVVGSVHTILSDRMIRPNLRTQYGYTVDGKGEINLTAPRLGDRHLRGIYSIEGNMLRICYAYDPDMRRPSQFVSPAGENVYLYEYERVEE